MGGVFEIRTAASKLAVRRWSPGLRPMVIKRSRLAGEEALFASGQPSAADSVVSRQYCALQKRGGGGLRRQLDEENVCARPGWTTSSVGRNCCDLAELSLAAKLWSFDSLAVGDEELPMN